MTKKFLVTFISAALILPSNAAPILPIMPPTKPLRYKTIAKGSTAQMTGAKNSLIGIKQIPPTTNFITICFFTGLDYNTNHLVYLQTCSNLTNAMTNLIGFNMNGQVVTNTFSSTNNSQYFHLMWNDGFTLPPNNILTIKPIAN